ncbi:MAG: signal peptidase I [Clostridia bacterium]|nr:signal peptidase I [Clostridia bacterium]
MSNEEFVQETPIQENESPKKNIWKEILDWVVSIAVAIVIALVIRNYVFTLVRVDGASMDPTLAHGDTLFTRIIGYTPAQGDIVIFHPPISETDRKPNKDTAYVKRVIALEGQEVDITPEGVTVDGELLEEDYILEEMNVIVPNSVEYPFVVPEDTIFVLGDNRNNSHDSRSKDVGAVPLENIIGKAHIRLLPFSTFGTLYK